MYEAFFGLDRRPFSFQPDATSIYWTSGHESAFATLQAGIERQCPITLVTGEIGCGKTTLIRHFLETAPVDLTIGLLSNFVSGSGSVLEWTLMAFDQSFEEGSEPDLLRRFQQFTVAEYAAGRRTALIVDEAQNVSAEDLESLRLLSNVNADDDVLLLMFLVGQPELRQRLKDPKYRQIGQRIGSDFHLSALTEAETAEYIRYLLEQAGAQHEVFDEESLGVIYGATSGIPRKINLLADLCMVFAFAEERRAIDAGFVRKILADLGERGIFASLTAPTAKLGAGQHVAPVEHVARAPKVVGLVGPGTPGAGTRPPSAMPAGRGHAEAHAEPEEAPGKDEATGNVVSSLDEARRPSPPPPDDAGAGQAAAVSDEETDAKPVSVATPEPGVAEAEPESAARGWYRYVLGAAALLAVAVGASFMDFSSEVSRPPEDPDRALAQFAHETAPVPLQEVPGSEEIGRLAALAGLPQSEVPNPSGSGSPPQVLALAGEPVAAPPRTLPAEVARPVPAVRTLTAMPESDLFSADPDDFAAAHRHSPLRQVSGRSAPSGLEDAVHAGLRAHEFRVPPLYVAVVRRPAPTPAGPVILRTSSGGTNGPERETVSVVRDTGRHESRPASRAPAGPFEMPSSARRVAWREASVLARGTGFEDRNIPAPFAKNASLGNPAEIAPLQLAALGAPGNLLGRAKQSVRFIPDGDALMLLNALDPQDRPALRQIPAGEALQTVSAGDAETDSGSELFKEALSLSLDDPTGAAVLYTRAALRGHKRSAYYLGQLFETGDGVSVDLSLARAWYSATGPGDSRAQRRIRSLPEPANRGTPPGAPVPLWAEAIPGGTSEFIWTSGPGGDAEFFFLQVAGSGGRVPEATYKVTLSGARLELPPSAAFWRVLAVDPASAQYAASDWIAVSGPGATPDLAGAASSGAEVVATAVIAHVPGGAAARVSEMGSALASMRIPSRTIASPDVVGTGDRIYFFYDQDRGAAEAVAKLISGDAENSVLKAAPSHDGIMALPGEILVAIGDTSG